jgi:hypothetical protein
MIMETKHTPGPLFVRQPEKYPFPVEIVNESGEVVFSEQRHAHGTGQKTVQDAMEARNMRYRGCPDDFVDNCIAANERQLADAYLRAAAPEMLAALKMAKWMLERDYIDPQKMKVIEMCDVAITKAQGE